MKTVTLTDESMEEAFAQARDVIEAEADVDVRDGDVVRVLAEAYLGYEFEGEVGDARCGPQVDRDELFGDSR